MKHLIHNQGLITNRGSGTINARFLSMSMGICSCAFIRNARTGVTTSLFIVILIVLPVFAAMSASAKPLKHGSHLMARVTFYYPGEGDCGTVSVTGERLIPWRSCAVDPRVIKLGSEINIPGIGRLLAHDTGSAVVSRKAALKMKAHLVVIDVCVPNAKVMERMAREFPPVVEVSLL